MKKLAIVILVLAMFPSFLTGCSTPGSGTVEHTHLYSTALQKNMDVDVYLPPHYNSHEKYPVLYLFHGKDGTQDSWISTSWWSDSIHIQNDATSLIRENKIKPLIIVSPEIDNSYGVDTSDKTSRVGDYNRGRYGTYLTKDLINYVQSHYSVSDKRTDRYIGGLSMGGFAALQIAFTHQDVYSKVGVMSAALWSGPLPSSLNWLYPNQSDKSNRDPITIAKQRKIAIPTDIIEGEQDPFYSSDLYLTKELRSESSPVAFREYQGSHDYAFWRDHANELLLFFAHK